MAYPTCSKPFTWLVAVAAPCFGLYAQLAPEVRDPGVRIGGVEVGTALPGANPHFLVEAREAFRQVHSVMADVEPGGGLGPRFNGTSCGGCHAYPAVGGSSPPQNTQFLMARAHGARNSFPPFLTPDGPVRIARRKFDERGAVNGSVVQLFTITGRSDARRCVIDQPEWSDLTNLSFRIPTPVFGAGLIESIPDSAIIANRNSQSRAKQELGIVGRPNVDLEGSIGRFGWKAQHFSLSRFVGEAYWVEMGVPNEYFSGPREALPEMCVSLYDVPYDDPTNYSGSYSVIEEPVSMLGNFIRALDQPKAVNSFPGASAASVRKGKHLFESVRCALCHTPALATGSQRDWSAMDHTPVHLYSDLLLHDMGPRLADGITQGSAGPYEFRTAPLWGLGQRVFFLHDGRTQDLLVAIQEHKSTGNRSASEANAVIDRFNALSAQERQDIVNFLRSL